MIRRIHIKGYKSLEDIELCNLNKLVVLIGANASGKSNLLDALDLIGHLAREDDVGEAFRKHRGSRGSKPIPTRMFFHGLSDTQEDRQIHIELDIQLHSPIKDSINRQLKEREKLEDLRRPYTKVTRTHLRYSLTIAYRAQHRALQVVHESLCALGRDGKTLESVKPYIQDRSEKKMSTVKLERQSHPLVFDLPRSRTLLSQVRDYVNHPHLVAVARELAALRVYYVEPARARAETNDTQAHDPGPNGEWLASFYFWLKQSAPVRYKNVEHNLSRLVTGLDGIRVEESRDGFLSLWVKERSGEEVPISLVSEGTLRLLCLIGIAATPEAPPVVGYEEPENGVHPARLREMLGLLRNSSERADGPQYVLTSHSPEIMDHLGVENLVLCTKSGRSSRFAPVSDSPLFSHGAVERLKSELAEGCSSIGQVVARGDV